MKIHSLLYRYIFLLGFFLTFVTLSAQTEDTDSIDKDDPDFVQVSLLVAAPGDVLYSCVGHAFLHLKCPAYNLDYIFSYESEDVSQKMLTFFAGNLKMGMLSVPYSEYIDTYRKEGRGVLEYPLNMPIEAKRHLWQILDSKVSEGANLPYDYLERGCAQSTLQSLTEVLVDYNIKYAPFPEKYKQTRREFVDRNLPNFPWTRFALYAIVGTEADADCTDLEKVVIPADLVELLQSAKIDGKPVITSSPKTLVPYQKPAQPGFFTPMLAACIMLLLAALVRIPEFKRYKVQAVKCPVVVKTFRGVLLVPYLLFSVFMTYLIACSSLPCTSWNWLLIPFNVLPFLAWHWRKYWARPFAIVILIWAIGMLVYPHRLVDSAYIIFALAYLILII